ncbi:Zinc finger, C2H2 type [Geosmithia morbida]|uniref:Zinc finger, C2H2 type n=1 Tax=Geosmithia morbida TaxID=1094350 RepID=A0A9P4YX14_9HYPO|nr:Zinc finger, C2H2 type [Geosmithia morbida]KAF4123367.1 Zinc finger, C2H2 type [Geosmithia morbida]
MDDSGNMSYGNSSWATTGTGSDEYFFNMLFGTDEPTDRSWNSPTSADSQQLSQWEDNIVMPPTEPPAKDDDAKSECSACDGEDCPSNACPSECGEDGHGSVCCRDEDCDSNVADRVCSDGSCSGARDPCEQEGCDPRRPELCLGDACEGADDACTHKDCESHPPGFCLRGACEAIGDACTHNGCFGDPLPSSTTGNGTEAAAAAAALASFGDMSGVNSFAGGSQLQAFGNPAFTFDPTTQPFPRQDASDMLNCMGPGRTDNAVLARVPQAFAANPQGPTQNGYPWPNRELLSHLRDYHATPHNHSNHTRPCLADYPNLAGAKCTLPTQVFSQLETGDVAGQSSPFQCGFLAQDPAMFADHVVSQHGDLLHQLPDSVFNFSPSDWKTFMQKAAEDWQHHGFGELNGTSQGACQLHEHSHGQNHHGYSHHDHSHHAHSHHAHSHHNHSHSNSHAHIHSHAHLPAKAGTDTLAQTTNPPSPASMVCSGHQLPTPDSALSPTSLSPFGNRSLEKQELKPDYSSASQSYGHHNVYQCSWTDSQTGHACNQNFQNSDDLDAHCREYHTKMLEKGTCGFRCMWRGFKPLECPICHMRLSAKQALDQHIRTHTNEHPYACTYEGCGKTFKQHSALTMHIRTHTKEKPLKCEICGAVFTESSNLSKHRRTHSKSGNFECDFCHKDFHRLDQLRRHLKTTHKEYDSETISNVIEKARHWRKKEEHAKRSGGMDDLSISSDNLYIMP